MICGESMAVAFDYLVRPFGCFDVCVSLQPKSTSLAAPVVSCWAASPHAGCSQGPHQPYVFFCCLLRLWQPLLHPHGLVGHPADVWLWARPVAEVLRELVLSWRVIRWCAFPLAEAVLVAAQAEAGMGAGG